MTPQGALAGALTASTGDTPISTAPQAMVPAWLMSCYFLIVVGGGVVANVLLLATTVRWCRERRPVGSVDDVDSMDSFQDADDDQEPPADRERGWWFLLGQLAATDALSLCLVSGGELWSVRETGGPWRLPSALCAPFMGLEAMLHAAQTYLLVALALHARTAPADPVPNLSVWRRVARSAVVPSALVWMLASSVAVPRTFLAVTVRPRPSHPICTLLPTAPGTGAMEGPLDVEVLDSLGPGASGSWWPLGAMSVDVQGGGPLLSSIMLFVAPVLLLVTTASVSAVQAIRHHPFRDETVACEDPCSPGTSTSTSGTRPRPLPPHKLARREWLWVSAWLSLSWLLLSLPRLASATVHGFLNPDEAPKLDAGPGLGPWAFRVPPLGSRVLGDASLLAASMLHYALTAARPVVAVLVSPSLRRAAATLTLATTATRQPQRDSSTFSDPN